MRRDGIPYVQNPKGFYPPIDINKLSLEELKQKFLKTCAKSQGNVSVCSKCKTPCAEGKRAIQLTANMVYSDPPVPLFAGKTLIERAKEDNEKRRAAEEAKKLQEKMELHADSDAKTQETKRKKYLKDEEWWNKSVESGDSVQYLIDTYGLSRTQAKKKVYNHNVRYGEKKHVEMPTLKTAEKKETSRNQEDPLPVSRDSNDLVTRTFELKIDDLMSKQSEYKKLAEKYAKLYEEVSEQIDVLCKAMDVFDKT